MAMSKYIIRAQDKVYCHLCESKTKLKGNFVDGDLVICDNCRHKLHPKFKNAKDHKIIDIKDIGIDTGQGERNLDFTNIKCKQHTKQACCLFCRTCDHLVCPSCVAKPHAGHQFLEIKEVYEMKVEKLKNGQRRMKKKKEQLKNGNKTLDSIKPTEESKHTKLKKDIQNQRKGLMKAVNLYSDKLLEEADKEINSIKDSVSKEKLKVKKNLKTVDNNEKQAENLIHTTDTTKFFDEVDKVRKLLNVHIPRINLNQTQMSQLVPGQFSQSNGRSLVKDTASDKAMDKIEIRVSQCFKPDMKHIHHTTVSPNGSLWIGDGTSEQLQNIRLDGGRFTMISSFRTELRGIAVRSDNTIIFTDSSSKLERISDSGTIIDSLLYIMAVHITTTQKLILGAISSDKAFPVTGRRIVLVLNQSGNQEKIYENDRHNRRILSYPHHITSTIENIFVVDSISEDYRGRIVVLSPDGDILNTYNGHPVINTHKKPFKPVCVVTTPSDNVLVTSANTDYIYILNNTGYLTNQINCKDHGVIYPYSMAFSTTGRLYIGTSPPTGSTHKAKLYEVKLSGC